MPVAGDHLGPVTARLEAGGEARLSLLSVGPFWKEHLGAPSLMSWPGVHSLPSKAGARDAALRGPKH